MGFCPHHRPIHSETWPELPDAGFGTRTRRSGGLELKGSYRPNTPGEVLVVVVVAAEVGEVEMAGHIRGYLSRTPIVEVFGLAAVAEVAQAGRPQILIHQGQLIAGRQVPAADTVEDEIGA